MVEVAIEFDAVFETTLPDGASITGFGQELVGTYRAVQVIKIEPGSIVATLLFSQVATSEFGSARDFLMSVGRCAPSACVQFKGASLCPRLINWPSIDLPDVLSQFASACIYSDVARSTSSQGFEGSQSSFNEPTTLSTFAAQSADHSESQSNDPGASTMLVIFIIVAVAIVLLLALALAGFVMVLSKRAAKQPIESGSGASPNRDSATPTTRNLQKSGQVHPENLDAESTAGTNKGVLPLTAAQEPPCKGKLARKISAPTLVEPVSPQSRRDSSLKGNDVVTLRQSPRTPMSRSERRDSKAAQKKPTRVTPLEVVDAQQNISATSRTSPNLGAVLREPRRRTSSSAGFQSVNRTGIAEGASPSPGGSPTLIVKRVVDRRSPSALVLAGNNDMAIPEFRSGTSASGTHFEAQHMSGAIDSESAGDAATSTSDDRIPGNEVHSELGLPTTSDTQHRLQEHVGAGSAARAQRNIQVRRERANALQERHDTSAVGTWARPARGSQGDTSTGTDLPNIRGSARLTVDV